MATNTKVDYQPIIQWFEKMQAFEAGAGHPASNWYGLAARCIQTVEEIKKDPKKNYKTIESICERALKGDTE